MGSGIFVAPTQSPVRLRITPELGRAFCLGGRWGISEHSEDFDTAHRIFGWACVGRFVGRHSKMLESLLDVPSSLSMPLPNFGKGE